MGKEPELDRIDPWLAGAACDDLPHLAYEWWIASVNRPAATRLIDWLHEHRPADRAVLLASGDLPLVVRLERPDMVGIDRLVDAVAVNRLRDAGRPAVIVDVGTAITVDLVSATGRSWAGRFCRAFRCPPVRCTTSPICCRRSTFRNWPRHPRPWAIRRSRP